MFLAEKDLAFDHGSATAFYDGYARSGGVIEPLGLFNGALFHALRYLWWGDTEQRWERVIHAVSRESELCAVIP